MLWNGLRHGASRGPLDLAALNAVCDRWGVNDLKLLGRGGPSDTLELLVTFKPETPTALRAWRGLQDELSVVCRRPVELLA